MTPVANMELVTVNCNEEHIESAAEFFSSKQCLRAIMKGEQSQNWRTAGRCKQRWNEGTGLS